MNFLSLCSGIDAASVAFGPLGWHALGFAEIEDFPSRVLAHHYPLIPNYGDMTRYASWPRSLYCDCDAIVGGPPCQAFSVAGARQSLDDARGNLTLTYAKLLDHADIIRAEDGKPPVVALYENVPGILSTKDNAFGCLLAALVGEDDALVPAGKRWSNAGCVVGPARTVAWRVLDAQYFGLPQRRKRVFVVASAREGFDPVSVLFEFDGVRRDSAPSRQAREGVAGPLDARAGNGGFPGSDGACANHGCSTLVAFGGNRCSGAVDVAAAAVNAKGGSGRMDFESETFVAGVMPTMLSGAFTEAGHGARSMETKDSYIVPEVIGFQSKQSSTSQSPSYDECTPTLDVAKAGGMAVAFAENSRAEVRLEGGDGSLAGSLKSGGGKVGQSYPAVLTEMRVRRLTPRECERLQGFPDNYTAIPMRRYAVRKITKNRPADLWAPAEGGGWWLLAADGPRYKALGNSWAVPCVQWIARRINEELEPLW